MSRNVADIVLRTGLGILHRAQVLFGNSRSHDNRRLLRVANTSRNGKLLRDRSIKYYFYKVDYGKHNLRKIYSITRTTSKEFVARGFYKNMILFFFLTFCRSGWVYKFIPIAVYRECSVCASCVEGWFSPTFSTP
ncbi:hypothetical protein PUN28_005817 [Cardiocondyla obscurior]|uniref:Uncharacterized protein n=1 Tax=Cardiocondyla obscurior TaxID=286306 RepID=A0AAW2G8J8_9HYME